MNRYVWLDVARAASALLVCAGHLRAVALVDYGELSSPGILVKTLYLLTGLEHQAVIVFFVLSGFLDGGKY